VDRIALALIVLGFAAASARAAGKVYPNRWVYVSRGLHQDKDVEDIRGIVQTAAEHGLNGMVLATGLDRLDLQPPHFFTRLEAVKEICAKHQIEIVPIIFSAGYGGSVLAHDKNLAEGIPVRDALFVAKGGEARLAPDPPAAVANGGVEDYQGNRVKAFGFHDKPGEISFVDTEVFKEGHASLRFENFAADKHGHARVMQEIAVKPGRSYRVSCWVKSEDLQPRGCFRVQIITPSDRYIAPWDPRVPPTTDWHRVVLGFNSLEFDKVRIYAGAWGARSGRFWIDGLRIEEVGLLNVLRRPGTPLSVRAEASGIAYEEGKDFAPIADPRLNFRFDHDGPPIKLLAGSRIQDGERLRVSHYHGMAINDGQVTACMSEPKVYEIWREQARLIQKHLAPAKWLLSMDEVRAGGSCEACKARKMTMGQIVGDCITKQFQMIREVNPKAEVSCWSDMLDPNHNAHGNYYLVEGDFTGSWTCVPKDLVIVCWYYEKRDQSLPFFSGLGFKTLAGAYYDADTLDNPKGWLEALDHTPGAIGIMYTTWRDKYRLLAPFGDLVSKR